jgi:hypothetical protein
MYECCVHGPTDLTFSCELELSPYYLHMKQQGKLLYSKMIRRAIWRWIETYPHEYEQVCGSDNRLLGGSEILFDMCSSSADTAKKKAIMWPLQTILLSLSPDLLLQAFLDNPSLQNNRRVRYIKVHTAWYSLLLCGCRQASWGFYASL